MAKTVDAIFRAMVCLARFGAALEQSHVRLAKVVAAFFADNCRRRPFEYTLEMAVVIAI